MLRIPYSECEHLSYTKGIEFFNPCIFCGFVFSGKYGPNRRGEPRVKQEIPFSLFYQGQNYEATTSNLSEKGVGIKILGKPPIEVKDILNFIIGDLSIVARVIWVRNRLPKLEVSPGHS